MNAIGLQIPVEMGPSPPSSSPDISTHTGSLREVTWKGSGSSPELFRPHHGRSYCTKLHFGLCVKSTDSQIHGVALKFHTVVA